MRNASAALIALINSGTQFYIADVLTIVRADGTIHRFTSAPVDITVVSQYDGASHTFSSGGVTFRRGATKLVVGLEVDDMDLTLLTDPTRDLVTIAGVQYTWPQMATLGYLDEARVMLERVFMATWGVTTPGTLIMFSGRLAEVNPARTQISTKVKSDLELLSLPMPRNVYQPSCLHTLYDSGCGLTKATFTFTGTAGAASTTSIVDVTALAKPDDYFALGAVTITNGPMAGLVRTIKSFAANLATVTKPFPQSTLGYTYSIYAGCDKRQSTCSGKFANLGRFRGFPYVPTPENAR